MYESMTMLCRDVAQATAGRYLQLETNEEWANQLCHTSEILYLVDTEHHYVGVRLTDKSKYNCVITTDTKIGTVQCGIGEYAYVQELTEQEKQSVDRFFKKAYESNRREI